MSGSAQRDPVPEPGNLFASGPGSAADLKQFAAERLAAHRSRRAAAAGSIAPDVMESSSAPLTRVPNAGRIREVVAARYQQSLSYHEYLAAEAEHTIQLARAEAEIAARNADAVEAAQTQLLEDLRQWRQPEARPAPPPAPVLVASATPVVAPLSPADPISVLPREEFASAAPEPVVAPAPPPSYSAPVASAADSAELSDLDQEIAFRLAPEFAVHHIEPLPLPTNLLEFPRLLVASRKARPRLAEGPLVADPNAESQLRIFEVETESIARTPTPPATEVHPPAPDWQRLELDARPAAAAVATDATIDAALDAASDLGLDAALDPVPWNPADSAIYTQPAQNAPLHTARVARRFLSATVDGCCLGAAWVALACVAAFAAGPTLAHLPRLLLEGLAAASALALYVVYHLLFFTFADATPGMRYAHLDFCTIDNENPTRAALRRRIGCTLLAACPLGLGLLWMAMDYDHLGWHDRMSKMYPREY